MSILYCIFIAYKWEKIFPRQKFPGLKGKIYCSYNSPSLKNHCRWGFPPPPPIPHHPHPLHLPSHFPSPSPPSPLPLLHYRQRETCPMSMQWTYQLPSYQGFCCHIFTRMLDLVLADLLELLRNHPLI